MRAKPTACKSGFLLLVLPMIVLSCASKGHWPAGIVDGRLAMCPETPNCVSSEDDAGPSRIAPLAFEGSSESAWSCLKRLVQPMGGTIEREDRDYLWAIFESRVFRFVDDMEFRMDAVNQRIHVRSASRTGYWDSGVNRRRVDALRQRFLEECNRLEGQAWVSGLRSNESKNGSFVESGVQLPTSEPSSIWCIGFPGKALRSMKDASGGMIRRRKSKAPLPKRLT